MILGAAVLFEYARHGRALTERDGRARREVLNERTAPFVCLKSMIKYVIIQYSGKQIKNRTVSLMTRMTKRFAAAALSVMMAVSCAGCSAAMDIAEEIEDRLGIELPFLPDRTPGEGDAEAVTEEQAASAGITANAESASVTEPGTEELTPGEERRNMEGKVLNIFCWDESLQSLFIMYYPEYEDTGERTGRIGNVKVNWVLPEDGQSYMDLVAEKLLGAEYLTQDERVDLYLAPEEDLAIYVNSDYSLDVREKLGLTDEELEDQFTFTQQMASTDEGVLKAVTWQANPGVFVYRRSFAKKVLGTDDPDAVQKRVKDWKTFARTGTAMKKEGYFLVSGYYDMYSAYRYGADRHWENNGVFEIPEAFTDWKNMMALLGRNKYHNKTIMGQDNWVRDQGPEGKVFGFFRGCTDIDSKMAAYSLADSDAAPAEGNGSYGDYAVCCGPQPYCRGGVWILAAPSTDNQTLDREIMENMTCDSELLYKIAKNENIFTNTVSGMKKVADEDEGDPFLGGQKAYKVYLDVATRISVLPAGNYDRWMADNYRDCVMKYLIGEKEEDEVLETFYQMVRDKYPELTVDY